MKCDGEDIYGNPCPVEARVTRSETVFEQGRRVNCDYNFCSACAHDFDEELGMLAVEEYANEC